MNQIMRDYYDIFELYQDLRNQLVDILSDGELAFTPGGENPPLGALCRQIGETERAYIVSFKSFEMDFSYRHDDLAVESDLEVLREWYQALDEELKEAVASLSNEALNRKIERGSDFHVSPRVQLEIYKEALLIFYGKVDVYLKAMRKQRPSRWKSWIG